MHSHIYLFMNNLNLQFGCVNAQGLRSRDKRLRLLEWIKQQKIDIMFINETHFTNDIVKEINHDFKGYCMYHSFYTSASRGCSILIKNGKFEHEVLDVINDRNGRYLLLNVNVSESILTLVNIYAPNIKSERNKFYETLSNVLENESKGLKFLGGDFNDTLSVNDRVSRSRKNNKTVKSLKTLINKNDLCDTMYMERNTQKERICVTSADSPGIQIFQRPKLRFLIMAQEHSPLANTHI